MKKTHRIKSIVTLTAIIYAMAVPCTIAVTTTWTGSADDDWSNMANWDNGVPQTGDDVIVNSGTLTLSSATPALTSYTQGGGVLTFTNWTTKLEATTVTLNVGSMTLPVAFTNSVMSNRVWIACTDLTLESSASINADGKGYSGGIALAKAPGFGPGAGAAYSGGGHGGKGGDYASPGTSGGSPQGSANEPLSPGSGGGSWNGTGGDGGGAVRIDAAGTVTLRGTISADGANRTGSSGGGGSGGGIYIACNILAGTNGIVRANGENAGSNGGGGGGGRIAVAYDTNAQSSAPKPNIQFSVSPGTAKISVKDGGLGTIYFPDARLLTETITGINGQLRGFSSWSPNNLVISNAWLRFSSDGFQLTVANDLRIYNDSGRLGLGGDAFYRSGFYYSDMTSSPSLSVGGDLTLTNGASLYIYSGMTNGVGINNGASVSIAKDVRIEDASWIYSSSHPTNGGSPLFTMRNLTIATTNSGFSADGRGYGYFGEAFQVGNGPGGGAVYKGGGYGGIGGGTGGGGTYGSSNAPVDSGSSGGGWSTSASSFGGVGGGLVRIAVSGTVTMDGTISANGSAGTGGGSGGGIYMTCKALAGGGGVLMANGGGGTGASNGSGGGGGRISVSRTLDKSSGISTYVDGGINTGTGGPGSTGTVVWGWIPPTGTIILIQ